MYIAMNHFRVAPDRCEEFERGWRDEAAFRAWTESEAFQKAHRQGRSTAGTILGPPRFVGHRREDSQRRLQANGSSNQTGTGSGK